MLAARPNEHGEGAEAVALAEKYIEASRKMADGVESGEFGTTKYDVTPILKLMERTDPDKGGSLKIKGSGAIEWGSEADDEAAETSGES